MLPILDIRTGGSVYQLLCVTKIIKMTEIKKSNFDWKLFLFLVLAVIVIQTCYYFFVQTNIIGLDKQGQFGDMFGALTALFSGFAFAGMITAIVLQTKELGYQREELALTRKELIGSRTAQEQQAKALRVSVELTALNTLAQESIRKETRYREQQSVGTYNIDGKDINELINKEIEDRQNYLNKTQGLLEIIDVK